MKHIKLNGLLVLLALITACKREPLPVLSPGEETIQSVGDQRTILAGKKPLPPVRLLDSSFVVNSLSFISADQSEGRNENTTGHLRVEEYIQTAFRDNLADSLSKGFRHSFAALQGVEGRNYLAKIKGNLYPENYIVVTAHYDHLGKDAQGNVYNGADDNASGTACLLGLANYLVKNPLKYSVLLIVTDMEEDGYLGAKSIVADLNSLGLLSKIKLNINLDMIARSDNNEIFAVGTREYPQLKYLIDGVQVKTNVHVIMGHDGRGPEADWSGLSDHIAFRTANVPFIYFGVEDHADYHQVTDDFEKINLSRYIENCNMILQVLQLVQ